MHLRISSTVHRAPVITSYCIPVNMRRRHIVSLLTPCPRLPLYGHWLLPLLHGPTILHGVTFCRLQHWFGRRGHA